MDGNIVEENEVFQVVLETPEGGGSVDAQFRANVTIFDDDIGKLSPAFTYPLVTRISSVAGQSFAFQIQTRTAQGIPMRMGGERFFSVIENYYARWVSPDTPSGTQRQSTRKTCNITDNGNGTYTIYGSLQEQGKYDLRTWHAFPGGLRGDYYYDTFMQDLALSRIDRVVNFTWGTGRLMPRGSDYISVRWSGVVRASSTGTCYFYFNADDFGRLWLDGNLLVDHAFQRKVYEEASHPVYLIKDVLYEIEIEYVEVVGEAWAYLLWGPSPNHLSVIPPEYLYSLYEIDKSPVEIDVVSTATTASTTECWGDGLFSATAAHETSFVVCPRDQYRNLRDDADNLFLSTELFSSSLVLIDDHGYYNGVGTERITPSMVYDVTTHCFVGTYTPERAGVYVMNVTYQTSFSDPYQHVLGSPFTVTVTPDRANGPMSRVYGLSATPLLLSAGSCYNYTVVMRDQHQNLLHAGGDNVEAYMYRVDYHTLSQGAPIQHSGIAGTPTRAPTSMPTGFLHNKYIAPVESDYSDPVIRYGIVTDLGTGNYSVEICPVIAGVYEVHVLLNGNGVSNQPIRVRDKWNSLKENWFGEGSYRGQYVDGSPFPLIVSHSTAVAVTSTAVGPGLISATVGVTATFQVTVRDAWDNVLVPPVTAFQLVTSLLRSPSASVFTWDYGNGTYAVEYIPVYSGDNMLAITINGFHIKGSPYLITVYDGQASANYSYVAGPGLHVGQTGVPSYFELFAFDFQGNRKNTTDDRYTFTVSGCLNSSAALSLCPMHLSHPICDPNDDYWGHYWGVFTPISTGTCVISVYLNESGSTAHPLQNSTFRSWIVPSNAVAAATTVQGLWLIYLTYCYFLL